MQSVITIASGHVEVSATLKILMVRTTMATVAWIKYLPIL